MWLVTCIVALQVLGKSAKPIPVLILGVLIGGKHYPRIKYLIVLLIVAGVALFFYKDGASANNGSQQPKLFNTIGFGETLIVSDCIHGVSCVLLASVDHFSGS